MAKKLPSFDPTTVKSVKYGRPMGAPKKITSFRVRCSFPNGSSDFEFYIGDPEPKHNPVSHQSHWLSSANGGTVPKEVLDSLEKLKNIAITNGIPCAEVCAYAMSSIQSSQETPAKSIAAPDLEQQLLDEFKQKYPNLSEAELLSMVHDYIDGKKDKTKTEDKSKADDKKPSALNAEKKHQDDVKGHKRAKLKKTSASGSGSSSTTGLHS